MTLNKFEIQVGLKAIEQSDNISIDAIRIPFNNFKEDRILAEQKGWEKNRVVLELVTPQDYQTTCGNRVFFTKPSEDIAAFKMNFPDIEVGAAAFTIADCKNLELAKVDYIQYDISGSNLSKSIESIPDLKSLLSRESEYGWDLLSLNTPVLIGNVKGLDQFTDIFNQADIKGLVLDDWNKDSKELILRIRQLTGDI